MPLFSFADISFKTNSFKADTKVGRETGFTYDTLRYPLDIGSADKGHYMMIYVNEQKDTKFATSGRSSELPSILNLNPVNRGPQTSGISSTIGNITNTINNSLSDASSTLSRQANQSQNGSIGGKVVGLVSAAAGAVVDGVIGGLDLVSSTLGASGLTNPDGTLNLEVRKIRRTSKAIALYMPDTLNFQYNQGYQDFSPGTNSFVAGVFAGSSAIDTFKKVGVPTNQKSVSDYIRNLGPFFANFKLGNIGSGALFGVVANPMLDLIYTSPELKTYRFDFAFYPRSQKEAQEVQKIISTLKFHQAPEISTIGNGYFLVPPSEFDIKFFYNGAENPNVPKITTCVLTSIDVDFAPNGFSAYEVPGQTTPKLGGTGTPVAIRVSLQFKETLYHTKEYYSDPSVNEMSDPVRPLFTAQNPVVTQTDTGRTTYFGG